MIHCCMAFLTRNKLPDDMLRLLRTRIRLRVRLLCLYFGLGSGVGFHGANKYDVETVCSVRLFPPGFPTVSVCLAT